MEVGEERERGGKGWATKRGEGRRKKEKGLQVTKPNGPNSAY